MNNNGGTFAVIFWLVLGFFIGLFIGKSLC